MYVTKTPAVVKALYRSLVWNMPRTTNTIYLTFDDGPHPEITEEVLTLLNRYNAKASFFCVGENVAKYQKTFDALLEHGHAVGNHTYNHLNGWQTEDKIYFENVEQCQNYTKSNLFRPPYGKITRSQTRHINQTHRIIMWDVLSADFDKTITPEKCLDNVIKNLQPGSIVVFHDSEKAYNNMMYALKGSLNYIAEKGWECKTL
jgi:peptidoglycan/xylan/chitin deacetylase (PgdA/CDA1 family)